MEEVEVEAKAEAEEKQNVNFYLSVSSSSPKQKQKQKQNINFYLSMSSPKQIQIVIVNNEDSVFILHFETLPTNLVADVISSSQMKISTDGEFNFVRFIPYNDLVTFLKYNSDFHYVPEGYRYGSYKNEGQIENQSGTCLTYIKEFWNCSHIPYKNGHEPFMSMLRHKPVIEYILSG